MDTPITPRRNIPTELKPRLRYRGTVGDFAMYTVSHACWASLQPKQKLAVVRDFGRATWGWMTVKFFIQSSGN